MLIFDNLLNEKKVLDFKNRIEITMEKIIIIAAGAILGLVILVLTAVSVYVANLIAHPHIISLADETIFEKSKNMWRNYEEYPKEEYKIKSFDGYELNTIYIPAETPSDKYVIISHGYSGCRLGSVKYLHLFRELGFNAIMYDDRGHGTNAKSPCFMGFKESRDLMKVIEHVYERFGDKIILGLHGESMGSALTNNALQYSPKVDFIVSDCGYNDLQKLIGYLINRQIHFPKWCAVTAGFFSKLFYGYAFREVSPIKYVSTTTIPICFFHGEDDDFIPSCHAEEMHKACVNNYSELHIIPGAGHAASVITDETAYKNIVKNFLMRINIL